MASATTLTHVSESLTPVAYATDQARSMSAVVPTFLKATATAMAIRKMSLASVVAHVNLTTTPMAFATERK